MKRTLAMLLLVVLCAATMWAERVSEAQARDIARKLLTDDMPGMNAPRRVSSHRMELDGEAPAYYLFTGADGEGMAVVAGDDVARPLLAYSPMAMTDGEMPEAMQEWLDNIAAQIRKARRSGREQTAEIARMWSQATADVGRDVVLLETALWGQHAPFNNLCPQYRGGRCLTGCVATAYAIMMRYHRFPSFGMGKTEQYVTETEKIKVPSRGLRHEYKWNEMLTDYRNGKYSTTAAAEVATLMADIGAAIEIDYGRDVTYGYTGHRSLFLNFGYNPGIYVNSDDVQSSEWHSMLQRELKMRRPIIYRAADPVDGGHVFIIDGYTSEDYYHVNWGWDASFNGYFTLDAMIPNEWYSYVEGQGAQIGTQPLSQSQERVVMSTGKDYLTVNEAVSAAPTDGTPVRITLQDDSRAWWTNVEEGQDITIDLNGFALMAMDVTNVRGRLTVTDSQGGGYMSIFVYNNAVLNNFGTLTLDGGTYVNESPWGYYETDYRRCIWAAEGSKTIIRNAEFQNNASSQTLCFNGDAEIKSALIDNRGDSYACSVFSGGNVTMEDCRVSAPWLFYAQSGSSLKCGKGLVSQYVDDFFLADGCTCEDNTDAATQKRYPYRIVSSSDGLHEVEAPAVRDVYYDLSGAAVQNPRRGIYIKHQQGRPARKVVVGRP